MAKNRNVPGQAEGFFLQETRLLYHLLNAKSGDAVFLEVFGDVAIKKSNGTVLTEEDKSTTSGNPITDRSENLWKTLSNWILSINDKILEINNTYFRIYVPTKNHYCDFVKRLHGANNKENAKIVFQYLKKQMWGDAPDFPLKPTISDSIAEYVERFFSSEDSAVEIILRFEFEQGELAGYKEIDEKLSQTFVPSDHLTIFRNQMLGWIKAKIDYLIVKKKPAMIAYNEFKYEADLFLRKLNREGLLISVAKQPTKDEAEQHIAQAPLYIRQLDYIEQDYDEKLSAVNDYLMAEDDRYEWIENGVIHKTSAEEFENNLKYTWKNIVGEVKIIHHDKPFDKQGSLIYYRCKQHKTNIENNPLPVHFIPGTYHLLANNTELGWHTEWSKLCSEDKKENGNVCTE